MDVLFVLIERFLAGRQPRPAGALWPARGAQVASICPTVLSLTRTRVTCPDGRASNSCVQVARAQP